MHLSTRSLILFATLIAGGGIIWLRTPPTPGRDKISELQVIPLPSKSDVKDVVPSFPSNFTHPSEVPIGDLPGRLRESVRRLQADGDPRHAVWAHAIAMGWRDFGAGVEIIRTAFPNGEVQEKIADLLVILSEERIDFFEKGLSFISDPRLRHSAVSQIAGLWTVKDFDRLQSYARLNLQGQTRNDVFAVGAQTLAWARRFQESASLLGELPFSIARDNAIITLASAWSEKDPIAALAWSANLTLPDEQKAADKAVLARAVVKLSIEELIALANASENQDRRNAIISGVASRLVNDDLVEAENWSKQLPELMRKTVMAKIAVKWSQTDATKATEYAFGLSDPEQRQWALGQICNTITKKDVTAAVAWLTTLPKEESYLQVRGVIRNWFRIDSIQASDWVNSLPNGLLRDNALAALAQNLALSDRSSAGELIKAINDPQIRANTTTWVSDLR